MIPLQVAPSLRTGDVERACPTGGQNTREDYPE